MSDDIPPGLPFSRAYMRPDKALKDDPRFRRRLSALFRDLNLSDDLGRWLKLRGGIELQSGYSGYLWDTFFQKAPLEDVLDAIGFIYSGSQSKSAISARAWKQGVTQILEEQAMAYRLDEACAEALRHF